MIRNPTHLPPSSSLWAALLGIKCRIGVAALLLFAGSASAKIERVVVFADRAEVTRVQTASCKGGAAEAVFSQLPDSVDERTLRGQSSSGTVVGVSSRKVNLEEDLDERVRKLRAEQRSLDDQLQELSRLDSDANERARTIQSYGPYFRAIAREQMRGSSANMTSWDQLLNTMKSEGMAQAKSGIERSAKRRKISRQRERVVARLARLRPASAPANLEASVALRCKGSAKVRLSYVVPGATWSPEYDLRFSSKRKSGKGTATLTVAGVIRQSSGEDWENAAIWLSTAKPKLGGEAPIPRPIYVNGQPIDQRRTLVSAQEKRAKDLSTGTQGQRRVQSAELEDGGKAFVLKLPRKVTVRADGRPYWFPVDEQKTKATATLVAVPKLSPYVFHVASFENPAPYPLMAGVMHVTRGATFVGDVASEYRAPGEPMEISLGVDEEIRVERKDLLERKRAAGLLSGTQHIDHAYRILLENRAKSAVTVEIREQIPVTKTKEVRVELHKKKRGKDTWATARGFTLDKKRGHLRWRVKIGTGKKAERDLSFTIHLPKAWKVN